MPRVLTTPLAIPLLAASMLTVALSFASAQPQRDSRPAREAASLTREPSRIRVIAQDYALEAPDSARAGSTAFEFENHGAKDHELFVGLLRPGVQTADIVAAHQKGLGFRQLQNAYLDGAAGGMLFALPGTRSAATLVVPLAAGRSYILLCQLRDSVGAPQHAALGMFHVLRVR